MASTRLKRKAPAKPAVTCDQLIPRREAYKMLGISHVTGWRRERYDPTFPKSVAIGTNRYAFRASELQKYIEGLQRRRDPARVEPVAEGA